MLVLIVILCIQVTQSDSQLRKLLSWRNVSNKSTEIYE